MIVQPGIRISQKHRCIRNCARTHPPPHVITNSFTSLRNADDCFCLTVVTYPGFPFPPYTSLYPPHGHVQAYHHNFASHFNLHSYIYLNHWLESAYWVGNASSGFWELSISTNGSPVEIIPPNETSTGNTPRHRSRITRHFDHLVVASGHNHYPKFPSWATDEAANEWLRNGKDRSIVHSVYYREPEEYAGTTVLVVGSGMSGRDIASQSSGHAKKVWPSPSPLSSAEIADRNTL